MVVSLRVVLDQLSQVVDPDIAAAEREVAAALVATAPRGCAVEAVVPAGDEAAAESAVPGLADVTRTSLSRARLSAAWQVGVAAGAGAGLIHAPSLFAPLVRHDRVNENDQTVVTVWDLTAWEHPGLLPKTAVMAQRTLLKRAEKHADALVVPTHSMAERLAGLGRFGGRIRVIAGAAPAGFAAPTDAVGRRRELRVPEGAIVLAAAGCEDDALSAGFAAVAAATGETGADLVVLDVPDARAARVRELATAAGVPQGRLRVTAPLEATDRAAVLADALALLAPSGTSVFCWRVVEALALGIPVVAATSAVHDEVLVDGGVHVPAAELGDALRALVTGEADRRRASVAALDRSKAYSWRDHAERVWALHGEL